MRLIIIGGGEIGYALSRALAHQHSIFVIDHNPGVAERFAPLDVEFLTGSGTNAAVLRRADVTRADLVVAATGLDEVNVVACSVATRLGAADTICLVSKEEFLGDLGDEDSLREHFGIHRILWPEAQLADDIERVIAAPGAIDAEAFADGQVQLREYRLTPDSPLTAGPLATLHLPMGSLVVAYKRGPDFTIPHGSTRLGAGDKVIVMGTREAMDEVQARVGAAEGEDGRRQLVTIIGGGDVGFRLAKRLDAKPDIELRVIERDAQRGETLAAELQRAMVLSGDGTDIELLEAEQIGRCDVLVSVIDNDERNLLASLLGRQLGVRKIITRVSKPANLRLFELVGIDVALSARGAAVASVVHQVEGGPTRSNLLAVLEEGQAQILELEVPPGYPSTPLRDLQAPPEAIVGAIVRGRDAVVPRGSDVIQSGDRLLVFCTSSSVDAVRDFFRKPPVGTETAR